MKTIIMAGGKGTRISTLYPNIPKPMIPIPPINNVPVLEREIVSLRDQGFTDIIITVSHLASAIMDYFGDGSGVSPATGELFGVHISYFCENTPLGNAGALFKLRDEIGDKPFLLLNADAVFDVDFNRMAAFHRKQSALVTLFTHPNSHPYDSGLLIADRNGAVEKWLAKEDARPEFYKNRVNAGLHIIDPMVLDMAADGKLYESGRQAAGGRLKDISEEPGSCVGRIGGINADKIGTVGADGKIIKVDLDRHLLKPLAGTGKMFCYDSPEYVKDMGVPERFRQVAADYSSGIVKAKNLSAKQKAVFLDRDGTINKYVGFLRDINEFELISGVAEAIKKINASGYLAIVVTNQPVIARGEVSFEELDQIHNKMETLLGFEGAYVDAIYYCPHHPHRGYEGEIPELKIDCKCRKPKPGMLLKAAEDFNIDLRKSFMVGDGENDMRCGIAAGCKSVLIRNSDWTGTGAESDEAEYGQMDTVVSVAEFAEKYL